MSNWNLPLTVTGKSLCWQYDVVVVVFSSIVMRFKVFNFGDEILSNLIAIGHLVPEL